MADASTGSLNLDFGRFFAFKLWPGFGQELVRTLRGGEKRDALVFCGALECLGWRSRGGDWQREAARSMLHNRRFAGDCLSHRDQGIDPVMRGPHDANPRASPE